MTKQTLLYIGHAFHNKTKSNLFLLDLLRKRYNIEFFFFDPYKDNPKTCFLPLKGKNYDILLLWQIMPRLFELKKYITFKKGVFFPMYDAAVFSLNNHIWDEYQDIQIINFCKKLHTHLKKRGFSSHYIQYFPSPSSITDIGSIKSVFFWQRRSEVNINTVERLLENNSIDHLHIHKALDPNENFTEPSNTLKYKISYSEWFKTKEELKKTMERSAIYIAPRLREGIGMSFLEAMALGRCVIAPNHPTMNEYIKNKVTGFLYNPSAPQAIKLNNIREIQEKTVKYIQKGFKKWEKKKWKILDWIEEKPIINKKRIQSHFKKLIREKYYLFGFIPLLKNEVEK